MVRCWGGITVRTILLLLLLSCNSYAATINAASCSQTDVQAAITAAEDGDTIRVPAGVCTWDNNIVITKSLKIIGSGKNVTQIVSNYTAVSPGITFTKGNFLVVFAPAIVASDTQFRISGFTFDLNNKCGGIYLNNNDPLHIPTKIRVDNNIIKNATNPNGTMRGIIVQTMYGVIDNNVFENCRQTIDSFGNDDTSWKNLTYEYGTANNIYYEDNTFVISNVAHDAGMGSRYCARYNNYTFTPTDYNIGPWLMAHGNQPNGNTATMGMELYGNILTSSVRGGIFCLHRGGKAVIFNNKIITGGSFSASAREEYSDSLNPPASGPTGQPQHVSDSYYWNNSYNSKIINFIASNFTQNNIEYQLTENIDFYNYNTSFNGTTGIGAGTLANRPTTCNPNVGYWATNQLIDDISGMVGANSVTPISGTLYKCTSTNTWTEFYSPYTYPHPLRSLNKPTNISIRDN